MVLRLSIASGDGALLALARICLRLQRRPLPLSVFSAFAPVYAIAPGPVLARECGDVRSWVTPRKGLRARIASLLVAGLLLMLSAALASAGDDLSREYRIKAAYLYNLSKFITWPDEESQGKDVPITLCVYGYNPFENYLEKLREHPVKGRSIAIRYVDEHQSVDNCQLLFISQHNTTAPKLLSAQPPYPPVLTVSDDQDFLARGGLVSLITVSNSVQLDINLTRAKQAGFSFSANLLEIAHRIQ